MVENMLQKNCNIGDGVLDEELMKNDISFGKLAKMAGDPFSFILKGVYGEIEYGNTFFSSGS